MSHVSSWLGAPTRNSMMTLTSLSSSTAPYALSRNRSESVRPRTPIVPACRKSRRVSPSQKCTQRSASNRIMSWPLVALRMMAGRQRRCQWPAAKRRTSGARVPGLESTLSESTRTRMPQMQMLDLELLINSRYPFIAVTTDEEDRLQDMLRRLAGRLGIPFYVWTSAQGLTRPPFTQLASMPDRQPLPALAQVAASREDGIYLFKDLHKFLGDAAVVRRLHDLAPVLNRGRRALFLTASDLDLPPEIRSLSA